MMLMVMVALKMMIMVITALRKPPTMTVAAEVSVAVPINLTPHKQVTNTLVQFR